MADFNWLHLAEGINHDNVHIATAAVASTALAASAFIGRLALGSGEKAVVPAGRFSVKGFFEIITEFIVGLSENVIGEKGRSFTPMFAALFFYILLNNFVGLIPGMTPATDNINTTIAIGVFSFVVYNFLGFREHGFGYLKQFAGPLLLLAPLMFAVELLSHVIRPFSLGLRLQANMMGDHMVLGTFLDMAPYIVPVPFYFLGMFVCFMQAFIFTILSMIYISMAISHDH